jgi:iron complex outermembrane receptor protein
MSGKWVLSLGMLGGVCVNLAWADEPAPELDRYQELPIVLTASRLEQRLSDAPSAMTVIDRKMIEASGFRSIPDLFKLVPGMYVSYYKGNTPIVSYHGSIDQYARAMQVMIDGRSIYMAPLSAVEWSAIPYTAEDIDRIEVIRGPSAASHGANSAQGVINIITRTPGRSQGAYVNYRQGDKGVKDAYVRLGGHGDSVDYKLSAANKIDEGFDNLTSLPANAAVNIGSLNNSFDSVMSRMLNYRVDVHPDGVNNFDIQLGFNNTIKQVGWTDSIGNQVHNLFTNAGFAQLGWTHAIDEGSELRLKYSHSRQDQHEAFQVRIDPRLVYQSMNVSRDDAEIEHTLSSNRNRFVYGAGYRFDQIDGRFSDLQPYFAASHTMLSTKEWRVFGHDELHLTDGAVLNIGGMLERDRMNRERFSPRLSVNYHLTPNHTIRTGISVAYRTPSLVETNPPLIQPGEIFMISQLPRTGNLEPEHVVSREVGYIGEFGEINALVDLRVYSDLTNNGIFPHQGQFVNALQIERRGVEGTYKQKLTDATDVLFNLSYQEAISNGADLAASGYTFLTSNVPWNRDIFGAAAPRVSGSLLLSQRIAGNLYGSLSYYYQDGLQPIDRGPLDRQGTQRRTDVRLAKLIHHGAGLEAKLELVVQNLFNHQYTEYVANNVFNRRGYVALSLQY